jgi:hypothetical protein
MLLKKDFEGGLRAILIQNEHHPQDRFKKSATMIRLLRADGRAQTFSTASTLRRHLPFLRSRMPLSLEPLKRALALKVRPPIRRIGRSYADTLLSPLLSPQWLHHFAIACRSLLNLIYRNISLR